MYPFTWEKDNTVSFKLQHTWVLCGLKGSSPYSWRRCLYTWIYTELSSPSVSILALCDREYLNLANESALEKKVNHQNQVSRTETKERPSLSPGFPSTWDHGQWEFRVHSRKSRHVHILLSSSSKSIIVSEKYSNTSISHNILDIDLCRMTVRVILGTV